MTKPVISYNDLMQGAKTFYVSTLDVVHLHLKFDFLDIVETLLVQNRTNLLVSKDSSRSCIRLVKNMAAFRPTKIVTSFGCHAN